MNTQQTYNRHHWLAVKQTIGINTVPSFLNTGCEPTSQRYRDRKYHLQGTYYIDILGIVDKLSIFFKGFTSLFTFSFQTDLRKEKKLNTTSILKISP